MRASILFDPKKCYKLITGMIKLNVTSILKPSRFLSCSLTYRQQSWKKQDYKIFDESFNAKPSIVQDKILTVPNALSMSRVVISPYFAYLAVQNTPESYTTLAYLVPVFALSDWLDGAIARKFPSQQSIIGSALDPWGDKMLVACLGGALAYTGALNPIVALSFIARDTWLILWSLYLRYKTVDKPVTVSKFFNAKNATVKFQASNLSKINTVLQMSLITSLVYIQTGWFCSPDLINHIGMQVFQVTTMGTTLASWWDYYHRKENVQTLS